MKLEKIFGKSRNFWLTWTTGWKPLR